MKYLITAGIITLLIGMLIGSQVGIDGLSSVLWSSAIEYQVVRLVLVIILLGLLFSTPPRSEGFRTGLVVVSVILLCSSITMLFSYQMRVFDVAVFMEVAIIFMIEAAESPAPLKLSNKRRRVAPQV